MSSRTVSYTLTRPKILVPTLFGLGLLLGKVSVFWGLGFLAFAVLAASKLLSDPALDQLLRLKAEKRRHGVQRLLHAGERQEILALDGYAQHLQRAGADPTLARATMDQAWAVVRTGGPRDTSEQLRHFRHGLPRLDAAGHTAETPVSAQISRELEILRAAHKEVESMSEA